MAPEATKPDAATNALLTAHKQHVARKQYHEKQLAIEAESIAQLEAELKTKGIDLTAPAPEA